MQLQLETSIHGGPGTHDSEIKQTHGLHAHGTPGKETIQQLLHNIATSVDWYILISTGKLLDKHTHPPHPSVVDRRHFTS